MKRGALGFVMSVSAALLTGPVAFSYPTQPVSITVPFPPGGLFDSVARIMGRYLQDEMETPIVVENRAGAGGALGTAYVARQEGDGYSLLLVGPSLITTLEANKLQGRPETYQIDDFVPVARVSSDPGVLLV